LELFHDTGKVTATGDYTPLSRTRAGVCACVCIQNYDKQFSFTLCKCTHKIYELCVTSSVMQMKSHLTPHLLLISWFLYLKQHLKVQGYCMYNDVG